MRGCGDAEMRRPRRAGRALPNARIGRLPATVRLTWLGSADERVRVDRPNDCLFGERHASHVLRHDVVGDDCVTPHLVGAGGSAEWGPFIISSDLLRVGELRGVAGRGRLLARCTASDAGDAVITAGEEGEPGLWIGIRSPCRNDLA